MNITYTIPSEKINRIVNTMKNLFPIPVDENGDPEFTDNQWAKEAIRRWVIGQVKRYEDYRDKQVVNNPLDDTIIS